MYYLNNLIIYLYYIFFKIKYIILIIFNKVICFYTYIYKISLPYYNYILPYYITIISTLLPYFHYYVCKPLLYTYNNYFSKYIKYLPISNVKSTFKSVQYYCSLFGYFIRYFYITVTDLLIRLYLYIYPNTKLFFYFTINFIKKHPFIEMGYFGNIIILSFILILFVDFFYIISVFGKYIFVYAYIVSILMMLLFLIVFTILYIHFGYKVVFITYMQIYILLLPIIFSTLVVSLLFDFDTLVMIRFNSIIFQDTFSILSIRFDNLSSIFSTTTLIIGFFTGTFQYIYMSSDLKKDRFFLYINYFIFSMLLFVHSSNFILMLLF